MTFDHAIVPAIAAFVAGAMNSVAGGGSFFSFPALIYAGVPPIPANATNNAAMWVGNIGSARGYRKEITEHRAILRPMLIVSVAGGLVGSLLLLITPPGLFWRLIPWLLLFATVIFGVSPWLVRDRPDTPRHATWQLAVQFFVAIYGGYFGAGAGILMLAILEFSGLPSFNAANGVKNFMQVVINGVALIPFAAARIVSWGFAIPMAIIALAGGYAGARLFRKVPQPLARITVVTLGIAMSIAFFLKGH